MTDAELDQLVAEARKMIRFPRIYFYYSDGPKCVSGLLDALAAVRGERDRLSQCARIMSNYIADYQMDEAEDRRACIDDEYHARAAKALEAARQALTGDTE